jgi:hypothetical protein
MKSRSALHRFTLWLTPVKLSTYFLTYLLTYLFTYLLTLWSRVLFEKQTSLQLVKKFPALCGTRRFITAFTSIRHLSLSWASSIRSIPHMVLLEDPSVDSVDTGFKLNTISKLWRKYSVELWFNSTLPLGLCSRSLVPKMCTADPKGSAASTQRSGGYFTVMATLKFAVLLKIIVELL